MNDLAEFLGRMGSVPANGLVRRVRRDQEDRWRRGERVPAERYIEDLPALAESAEDARVVICGEFLLVRELEGDADPASFCRRFPQWREELEQDLLMLLELEADPPDRASGSTTAPMTPGPDGEDDSGVPGYELGPVLGRGSMGVVYRARQASLDRVVALKRMRAGAFATPEELARFRVEAEAVACMQHVNIVQIHEFSSHNGRPYLVMELLEGGALQVATDDSDVPLPRPPAQAAALVRKLAEAVHHAHLRGVIHRDLKPANVLLSQPLDPHSTDWPEAVVPKIADFGLARRAGDRPESDGLCGTPAYMAPEQALKGEVTAATDVWALGVILYELLTGQRPFRGETATELILRVLEASPVRPRDLAPDIPPGLEVICLKCLQKEPSRRYASAAALAHDLRAELDGPRQAAALVLSLETAEASRLPQLLREIDERRGWADRPLRQLLARAAPGSPEELRARLALLPGDPTQTRPVLDALPRCRPEEVPVFRAALRSRRDEVVDELWRVLTAGDNSGAELRAACLLAEYCPDDARWGAVWGGLVPRLVRERPLEVARLAEELRRAAAFAVPPLTDLLRDAALTEAEWLLAADWLLHHTPEDRSAPAERTALLAEVLTHAPGWRAHDLLLRPLQARREDAVLPLRAVLGTEALPGDEPAREALARRQARAAVALVQLGQPQDAWRLLGAAPLPDARSELIPRLAALRVEPDLLARRLTGDETDDRARQGLVQALGDYDSAELSPPVREQLLAWLTDAYARTPDAGLRSAVGWLLTSAWGLPEAAALEEADRRLSGWPAGAGQRWWVTVGGETMVLVRGPVQFSMGAPAQEAAGRKKEGQHWRRIDRSFAVAAREVTVDQFRRFQQYLAARPDLTKTNPWLSWRHYEEYSPEGCCAAITVSWYQAAAFCRWLSEQEGVSDGEMCYPELEAIQPGRLTMPRGHLGRTGYRLPTEAEWEYACRAGTAGRRPFGSAEELLPRYAWMLRNGEGCSQPVGRLRPNDLGLFDIIGNVWEWCQDRHRDYPAGTQERPAADEEDGERVIDNEAARMLRGGSSVDGPKLLRSAMRCDYPPDSRDCTVGFRLACTWREPR